MAKGLKFNATVLLWMVALLSAWAAPDILPPLDPDPAQVARLQRTLTLLNSSTPAHRNTVRILFYGQSITLQDWWWTVAQSLRSDYPNANLIIENRAIFGHTVDQLLRNAQADVYPFQPDLIIFQAYGPEEAHEQFQRSLHLRTCADVLWQNDHFAIWDGDGLNPLPASALTPTNADWHSLVFLPQAAARYGNCLADVRTPWRNYLLTNEILPARLLVDQIHLNTAGQKLLAHIVQPYLAPREVYGWPDPYNSQGVHTYRVGEEIQWLNRALAVPVIGSRIDVILGPGATMPIEAQIDGQSPTRFPETWTFTRTTPFGFLGAPCLLRVDSAARLQAEHWELTVTERVGRTFAFSLRGSVTGEDGVGTNTMVFRSNSGRVVLHPEDWSLQTPSVGFQVSWEAVPLATDRFQAAPPADERTERVITIAQNLSDDFHLLLLKAGEPGTPAIRAIRVYSPAERFAATYQPPAMQLVFGRGGEPQLQWPAWLPGWRPERSGALDRSAEWEPIRDDPVRSGQRLTLDAPGGGPIHFYRLRFTGGVEGL